MILLFSIRDLIAERKKEQTRFVVSITNKYDREPERERERKEK